MVGGWGGRRRDTGFELKQCKQGQERDEEAKDWIYDSCVSSFLSDPPPLFPLRPTQGAQERRGIWGCALCVVHPIPPPLSSSRGGSGCSFFCPSFMRASFTTTEALKIAGCDSAAVVMWFSFLHAYVHLVVLLDMHKHSKCDVLAFALPHPHARHPHITAYHGAAAVRRCSLLVWCIASLPSRPSVAFCGPIISLSLNPQPSFSPLAPVSV